MLTWMQMWHRQGDKRVICIHFQYGITDWFDWATD